MKTKLLLFITLVVFSTSSVLSLDNYPFSVGASIAGKMGINAGTVPSGLQNSLSFLRGVDLAAMVYLPMSDESRTGVFVELGYTNTPFGLKQYGTNYTSWLNQKWLTISPVLLMSGVSIGLEFGFDIFENTIDEEYYMFGHAPVKEDFNVSLRVGYMYPILSTPLGILNFAVNGTYNITGSNFGDITYNPATVALGLNYLFNLAFSENF